MNNKIDWSGRVAFIAGGTSGINLQIGRRLSSMGVRVAVMGRNPEKAKKAEQELEKCGSEAIGISCDVRDYASLQKATEEVSNKFNSQFHIVISGAAGNFLCAAEDLSPGGFKAVVDIDLIGSFNVFKACFKHTIKPGGAMLSITAPQAVVPYFNQAHACAAKAGLNMLTKCLALEWGPLGIRVNGISPGPIAGTEGVARLNTNEESTNPYQEKLPLGRMGSTDEVANMALFLCSQEAQYITGSIHNCDGGISLMSQGKPTKT